MNQRINRQWRLLRRPTGMVTEADFGLQEGPVPDPAEGEILVRTLYVSFDPAMRAFLTDRPSYIPPQPVGQVMRAGAIGQVIESRQPDFQPGTLVVGTYGWQEHEAVNPKQGVMKLSARHAPTDDMSVLGGIGLTAYVGLLDVGAAKAGETVVISGAAGATGSTVVQIARIVGCRTVAIAGGPHKARWTKDV